MSSHPTASKILVRLVYSVAALFALDRLLKLIAIIHFFRRPAPPRPPRWPQVTLIQPITRGASNLASALQARMQLSYPAEIQHLLICDAQDRHSQELCNAVLHQYPAAWAQLVLVESQGQGIASKTRKLQAALPLATGEVFCFIDDDVTPRHNMLEILLPFLLQPGVGAVFGLPCYTNWRTRWSSLMSGFVNANALLSYIPLSYLTEPFTITGHCFALQSKIFQATGGFEGMEWRIDDDHEMARRVRHLGLRCVQTPMIYDVDNDFDSFQSYAKQMKRWFIFPRQAMLPSLTAKEQAISFLGSVSNVIPGILAVLAAYTRKRAAFRALITSLGLFGTIYTFCQVRYLQRSIPCTRWPLLLIVALFTPLHILWALLSNEEIEWRGQRLRIRRGGTMEELS
jgi:ceramide glucosyltransferase